MKTTSLSTWALLGSSANALPGLRTRAHTGKDVTGSLRSPRQNSESGVLNIPLKKWTAHNADLQWYGTVSVGTPPQNLTVIFDTGTNLLLVPAANCTTCGSHARFDASQSSTFQNLPNSAAGYKFLFSTWGDSNAMPRFDGPTCHYQLETVTAAGVGVDNFEFINCDTYPSFMADMVPDGVMGIGTGGIYWNMSLPDPIFSTSFVAGPSDEGQLTLGGTDPDRFEGEIAYVPLDVKATDDYGAWTIGVNAVFFDGKVVTNTSNGGAPLTDNLAMVDTGTASILGPDKTAVADLYSQISSEIQPIDDYGTWGGPCETIDRVAVDVTLTVGQGSQLFNMTIPKEDFNLGESLGQPGICQALFIHSLSPRGIFGLSQTKPSWMIGGPALKQYYTVWNPRDMVMGFAAPKKLNMSI